MELKTGTIKSLPRSGWDVDKVGIGMVGFWLFSTNTAKLLCRLPYTCVPLTKSICSVYFDWYLPIYPLKRLNGVVLRWQRNRMGRPLFPPQIHQKII